MIAISAYFKIAFSVAGTVIGAGFATGKELALFFPGNAFPSTVLLCCSLALMCIVSVFYFEQQKNASSCPVTKRLKPILIAFSGACYCVMLACGGEAIRTATPLPFVLGVAITYALTLLILRLGINGVYRFNLIATPVLIAGILLCSLIGICIPVSCFKNNVRPIGSALVYTGYNLLSLLPFIGAIAPGTDIRNGKKGITAGFFLVLLSGVLLKTVLNRFPTITNEESLPMLKIIETVSPFLSDIYSILLYLAVLTTAVSCLYAITGGKHLLQISGILFACSFLGFSLLLEKFYTWFGYLGIFIIPFTLFSFKKSSKKERIKHYGK